MEKFHLPSTPLPEDVPLTAPWTVASHNIMDGHRLAGLLRVYSRLATRWRLGALCLQENVGSTEASHAHEVLDSLGEGYELHVAEGAPRNAILVHRNFISVENVVHVELPMLDELPQWQRFYIKARGPELKHAVILQGKDANGMELTVVNFHLDAGGDNAHRQKQLRAVVEHLDALGVRGRIVACGDTNAFAFRRRRQAQALAKVLEPLGERGIRDTDHAPTHYFARAREPALAQRVVVFLGRFGLDVPGRFDVVCTDLPVRSGGFYRTPDSDHDLVWIQLTPDFGP